MSESRFYDLKVEFQDNNNDIDEEADFQRFCYSIDYESSWNADDIFGFYYSGGKDDTRESSSHCTLGMMNDANTVPEHDRNSDTMTFVANSADKGDTEVSKRNTMHRHPTTGIGGKATHVRLVRPVYMRTSRSKSNSVEDDDIRLTYAKKFINAFNGFDRADMAHKLQSWCTADCVYTIKWVGDKGNPAGPNERQVHGVASVASFLAAIMTEAPDGVVQLLHSKLRIKPDKFSYLICKFCYKGTQISIMQPLTTTPPGARRTVVPTAPNGLVHQPITGATPTATNGITGATPTATNGITGATTIATDGITGATPTATNGITGAATTVATISATSTSCDSTTTTTSRDSTTATTAPTVPTTTASSLIRDSYPEEVQTSTESIYMSKRRRKKRKRIKADTDSDIVNIPTNISTSSCNNRNASSSSSSSGGGAGSISIDSIQNGITSCDSGSGPPADSGPTPQNIFVVDALLPEMVKMSLIGTMILHINPAKKIYRFEFIQQVLHVKYSDMDKSI